MARSSSSGRWLREHHADRYVQRSRAEGYRSRASYKLLEIARGDRLIRHGDLVVDLGAAPGGWSQVAAELAGPTGRVVASDLLPMAPLAGIEFVQGDFSEDRVFEALLAALGSAKADLVISDMAPNLSGVRAVDQPRAMYLSELALEFAHKTLRPGGNFLCKAFHGEGFDAFVCALRPAFGRVVTRKPEASRGRSREVYLLARDFRG